jgi:predicted DsbA family dithiol-disulfide isomerase
VQAIEISVNYDFICPWCWIGHLKLASGIREANLPVPVSIQYVPFELNPTMPADGMDRRSRRRRRRCPVQLRQGHAHPEHAPRPSTHAIRHEQR